MKEKFQKLFSTISLKKQIFLGYMVLILVPLCTVTTISTYRSVKILEEKTQRQLGMTCEAVNKQYDTFINDIEVISKDIICNTHLQEALMRSVDTAKKESYTSLQYQLQIESYLQGIRTRKPGIHSILIYGENSQNFSASSSWSWDVMYDAKEENWFREIVVNEKNFILTGIRDENQLFSYNIPMPQVITMARTIKDMNTFKNLGVLQVNMDVEYLSYLGMELAGDGYIGIFDDKGNTIFTNWRGEEEAFIVERVSEITGWKTIYYAPKNELLKETKDTTQFLWMVAAVVTLLGMFFAQVLTWSIMLPIKKIDRQVEMVSQGDFTRRITYKRQDEMGALIDGFNRMTQRVHELIREIQDKEEQRRKTEIDALQARINPHFMYNTLNSIRLTAMLHKDEEITEQLTAFVYLLKNASQSGGEAITIRKELEIIKAYCALMKYRYENFILTVQGSQEVEHLLVLPFIIQPLVENSIFHGIAALKRQGTISIVLKKKFDTVCMTLSDDGLGMEEDTVKKLLSGESNPSNTMNHVGMKNVLDRMRLYFGEQTHMEVYSQVGKGTVIRLEWPAISTEEAYAEGNDC